MNRSLLLTFSLISALGSKPLWAQKAPMNPYTLGSMKDGNDMPSRTALSPDGKIAALSGDNESKHSHWVRLYDTASRHLLYEIAAHHASVSDLLFTPDGKQLLTQDQDGGTLISEVPSGREVRWLIPAKKGSGYVGESEADIFFAWSKDGKQLLSRPNMNKTPPLLQLRLWDVKTGAVRTLAPTTVWDGDTTFDNEGNVVIAEVEKNRVRVRRLDSNNGHPISRADFGAGLGARLSPDGRFLLSTLTYGRDEAPTATAKETISVLWDVATHRKLATLTGLMRSSEFSGDGKTLVTSDSQGNIVLRDLAPGHYGTIRRELPPFSSGELDYLAVSNDANWIFSIDSWAPARLWNLREALTPFCYPLKTTLTHFNGQQTRVVAGGFRTVGAMGRLPSTRLEVQEMHDGILKNWQVSLNDDHLLLEPLEIAPGGKFLVAHWRKENKIEIYDLDAKVLTCTWRAPEKLLGVRFSPDGSRLAEASTEGKIKIYDLSGKILLSWDAAAGSLKKMEWSPDGTSLATLGDGFLTLWDTKTGKEKKTLTTANTREEFAWSPDSRTIAVAIGPKAEQYHVDQILLVDAERGEIPRTIPLSSPKRTAGHLKFSPDGTIVGVIQWFSLSLFHVTDGSAVPVPNDDCPVFDFTWTAPSELALDTGARLKIWQLEPERLARTPKGTNSQFVAH